MEETIAVDDTKTPCTRPTTTTFYAKSSNTITPCVCVKHAERSFLQNEIEVFKPHSVAFESVQKKFEVTSLAIISNPLSHFEVKASAVHDIINTMMKDFRKKMARISSVNFFCWFTVHKC